MATCLQRILFVAALVVAASTHAAAAPVTVSSAADTILEVNTNLSVDAFETDILLTDKQKEILLKASAAHHYRQNSISDQGASAIQTDIWPNSTIPLMIDSDVDKDKIWKAAEFWEEHTCLKFVTRTTENDYVRILGYGGCGSYVGRIFGEQKMYFSFYCDEGAAIHELGHVIGFWHEQSRTDRDSYVTIIWENIKIGRAGQFQKYSHSVIDSLGIEYDYNSVMHYSFFAYSSNGEATVVPVQDGVSIGQRQKPSDLDIIQANLMYSCSLVSPINSSIDTSNTEDVPKNEEEEHGPISPDSLDIFMLQHVASGQCLTVQVVEHGYKLSDPFNTEYEATFGTCNNRIWASKWMWDAKGHIIHAATKLCLSSKEKRADLVLRSCKAKTWRINWLCNKYLIVQPESSYCLYSREKDRNDRVIIPHSLEKELSEMLRRPGDFDIISPPLAGLDRCSHDKNQQKFVLYNTSKPICSSFPLLEIPFCYTENDTNEEGWIRCKKNGHYVSGFTFKSLSSPVINGLVCCMSPLPRKERGDNSSLLYPLAEATECYQRNWWTSYAASQFQCHHGEFLNGIRFIGLSVQRGECCRLERKKIKNGYNECKKENGVTDNLVCSGGKEQGKKRKGVHVTGYRYSSIMCNSGQCPKEIECCN